MQIVFKERKGNGKRQPEVVVSCAGQLPGKTIAQLPFIMINLFGNPTKALLDTGCSKSMFSRKLITGKSKTFYSPTNIVLANGSEINCKDECNVSIEWYKVEAKFDAIVVDNIGFCEAILGIDFVSNIGGVVVSSDLQCQPISKLKNNAGSVVVPSNLQCSFALKTKKREENEEFANICSSRKDPIITIKDTDFTCVFESGRWVVRWQWSKGGLDGPSLKGNVSEYDISPARREEYEKEVNRWISEGWLIPYQGECKALLPLMAVYNHNKGKVRPVLDYRRVNEYLAPHTGDSDVCQDKLRKWRRLGENLKILDLKNAYLQVHVAQDLWKFQVVRFKGKQYCLSRLGFGLNIAPKIMTSIVNRVLSSNDRIQRGTDSYIDDIIVNEDVVSIKEVMEQLSKYGLEFKEPEDLSNARVLGLRVLTKGSDLIWQRDNVINSIEKNDSSITKQELFSICGKLIGHYPSAGWLRPAVSFVKRMTNDVDWKDFIDENVLKILKEILQRIETDDPVKGFWEAPKSSKGTLWCDASSLALGTVLEIEGKIVEDGSWLRKQDDANHINIAELEAVLKGVNLAMKWDLTELNIMTDSASVFGWLHSIITKNKRIKVHGLSEMLVQRRLSILSDLFQQYGIQVRVFKVSSSENKADSLTRVPQKWLSANLTTMPQVCNYSVAMDSQESLIKSIHNKFHCGREKTKYVVKEIYPDIEIIDEVINKVISECHQCNAIDPAPVHWNTGHLEVEEIWSRVAIDVTHYAGEKFLTIIDSGPSRYAIWRKIANESSDLICEELSKVFISFGPPKELVLDNYLSFHSQMLKNLCDQWRITLHFRCANRPACNGIIERCHRTVKRIAARSDISVIKAVFWYNAIPKRNQDSPFFMFYGRKCQLPIKKNGEKSENEESKGGTFSKGDYVYVKPYPNKCTTKWAVKQISRLTKNPVVVEIEGVPHHVADIRKCGKNVTEGDEGINIQINSEQQNVNETIETERQNEEGWTVVSHRRNLRENRVPPARYGYDL